MLACKAKKSSFDKYSSSSRGAAETYFFGIYYFCRIYQNLLNVSRFSRTLTWVLPPSPTPSLELSPWPSRLCGIYSKMYRDFLINPGSCWSSRRARKRRRYRRHWLCKNKSIMWALASTTMTSIAPNFSGTFITDGFKEINFLSDRVSHPHFFTCCVFYDE